MKIYYGMTIEGNEIRNIYATVTGQMADGRLVYTEIKQNEDGSIVTDRFNDPELILDNQYTRHLYRGTQTFERL